MNPTDPQDYRERQIRLVPFEVGVYALCDLDEVPIYVGQSTDGIRARVRRHLTSARSDVIANRMIDVWEVAFVWSWPIEEQLIGPLEAFLYHQFDKRKRLMNGSVPPNPGKLKFKVPPVQRAQVMEDDEINARQRPSLRLPRQIWQFNQLVDYILIVQDKAHLRQALKAHYERLTAYYEAFLAD